MYILDIRILKNQKNFIRIKELNNNKIGNEDEMFIYLFIYRSAIQVSLYVFCVLQVKTISYFKKRFSKLYQQFVLDLILKIQL